MNKIRQKGLSLVELIIGVALASVIIGGVIQVFLSNRQAFTMTESLVRIQENGRFALDFIGSAVRDAGNYGCIAEYSPLSENIQSHIAGLNDFGAVLNDSSDGAAAATTATGSASFDEPDTLSLLSVTSNSSIIDNTTITAGEIALESNPVADFNSGDSLLVSNCLVGDFITAGVGTDDDTIDVSTVANYRASQYTLLNQVSIVSEVNQVAFTVNSNELFVTDDGANQALLDGIENIQFTYGVDTDGNFVPDYFDDYANIPTTEQNDIIAVKVSVLAVSNLEVVNNVVTDFQTITFNNQDDVVMTDLLLRKVFESTITLRNRMN